MALCLENVKAMKLVHLCSSIDWAAFDSNITLLEGNSVVERHLAEVSGFQGSLGAWEKIAKHSFVGTARHVFVFEEVRHNYLIFRKMHHTLTDGEF